jgi:hypothetical protein
VRSRSALVTLALAAVAYVVAGFFTDLPPRGIYLDGSQSWISLSPGFVQVTGQLTYVNRSWRPRRTDVYLPFGEGDVKSFSAPHAERWRRFPDGVVLSLALSSGQRYTFDFNFIQAVVGKRYDYRFTTARGWDFPPNLVELNVDADAALSLHLSVPPDQTKKQGDRTRYRLPGDQGKGLTITWD